MGSGKVKIFEGKTKESSKMMKTYMACLWSFLVSLAGGLLLAWWEYEYHPENRQLWMVPFGLILFSTPLIIWFAIFVSDICSCTEDVTQPGDGSNHEPGKVNYVPASCQVADIFTKSIAISKFEEFRAQLCVKSFEDVKEHEKC